SFSRYDAPRSFRFASAPVDATREMIASLGRMEQSDSSSSRPAEGRRFHLTLLFSDMCDYTKLSEASDPEETGMLKSQIERAAQEIMRKHGGTVNQFYGDGILVVFGFPKPGENDVRHAVEAALEFHEIVRATRI